MAHSGTTSSKQMLQNDRRKYESNTFTCVAIADQDEEVKGEEG